MTVNPFTARARALVASVALPPTFPIRSFVAANPLHGLEHRTFEDAARTAAATTGARSFLSEDDYRSLHSAGRITEADLRAAEERYPKGVRDPLVAGADGNGFSVVPTLTERIDAERGTHLASDVDAVLAKWCAAYLDEGQGVWELPHRHLGLYGSWRALAPHDPGLARLAGRTARRRVRDLPHDGAQALSELIARRNISEVVLSDYFRAAYRRLPGWASALARSGDSDDLVGYLAIRLALEDLVLEPGVVAADERVLVTSEKIASVDRLSVWQEALELGYRDHLLDLLSQPSSTPRAPDTPPVPETQVVFCIDVRSEGMRRHLEAVGPYSTVGFAGFFGLPIRVALLEQDPVASCPVIVEPRATIPEVPDVDAERATQVHDRHDASRTAWEAGHEAKTAVASPFAFAEAAGWVLGPLAALRTFAPRRAAGLLATVRPDVEPTMPTRMAVERSDEHGPFGLSDAEQIAMAYGALTTMCMTSDFSALVLLCGHRSTTSNNPFGAALDCGACAGKAGGPNARVLAEILNRPPVRDGLCEAGIVVPESTCFVAAEHDTTTDEVRILDRHRVPATHQERLARLIGDLAVAGRLCAGERQRLLPGGSDSAADSTATSATTAASRRADDWAEPVAEWGLVRNAAAVVGPRSLTAGKDLERRVFLHSYEPDEDPDGVALGAILTGPLVVGHWISSQYYFSTVDPDRYGAGTKPLHNPVGGIGVYEGVGGDLRTGLPLESVSFAGRRVHEPMRLLAVVQAPRQRLDMLISANSAVAQLLRNGWVRLVAGSNGDDGWAERRRDGTWEPWPRRPDSDATAEATTTTVTDHALMPMPELEELTMEER